MLRLAGKFLKSRSGSLIPIFAIGMIPMVAAVGLSVDYTAAVTDKGDMQGALDAATLGIMTLPTTTTTAARQQSLQDQFTANSGQGTVTLNSFTVAADGTATANTSASYAMPTDFMQIAQISTVQIGVTSSVTKTPALVQATFKIDKASGWWNKTIYLWGTQFGAITAQKLMQISYTYNGAGDPKGYGTTTVYTVSGTQLTQVQQQVCSTSTVKNFNNAPAGSIERTSGSKNYLTTCTTTPANGTGAVIDVSQMNSLYLEMDVPSGNPTVLKSNDPTKSNYLFIGATDTTAVEMPLGQAIDIFTAVPCGQSSTQAWEDGGSSVPEPITDADFFYSVTGKCDFNQRPSQTVLTQ
ncbi:pilus assembly protein [Mesorhizobium sp. PAMC28654]|uniref:TadE/TadG family type IV pilus assembly protein n=1 Tax=Mesorhizobium sp. PAMC28654 TaxID=2880934 RepID=UPI001D0BCD2D|nr:TadE/TadG family type IV pilus assembly protein [Mesorhizobium sp. PAMC28654]UDL87369.1 pilus assembly protein [Mesorhizobium sp. PAMC28654]